MLTRGFVGQYPGATTQVGFIPAEPLTALDAYLKLDTAARVAADRNALRARAVAAAGRVPSLALSDLPKDTPLGLRRFLERVKEALEVRNAQRGSPLDAQPTYRDLIDAGLLQIDPNSPLTASGRQFTIEQAKTWMTAAIPTWVSDTTAPSPPTGLVVVPNTANLVLAWDAYTASNYGQTLVYRATENNLSLAEPIGSTTGATYLDELPPTGQAYFYWIRHESKAKLLSDFNDVNGASVGNVTGAPTISHEFDGPDLILSWPGVTSNLAVQYYIIRHGTSFGAGVAVGVSNTQSQRLTCLFGGTRTFWVAGVDINGAIGQAGSLAVTVTPPAAPTIAASIEQASIVLSYGAAGGSLPVAGYEVRFGATWEAGLTLTAGAATRFSKPVDWTGSGTFWVAAIDTAGNTGTPTDYTFVPELPSTPSITPQVIDNNVLLRWSDATATLPIAYYNIRKNGTLIGTVQAGFATIFESQAGSYTYSVEAVDTAGNVGAAGSSTATVNQPPDFVLFSNLDSTFSGTKTNALLDNGVLYANVDTAETWEQHFTNRGWSTIQDQIDAGYPNFLIGKTTGSYVETVDYGSTIPSTKLTMSPTDAFTSGTVTKTPTISVSADNVSYTDFAGTWSAYGTAFRYARYKIDFTAAHTGTGLATDTAALVGVEPLNFRLDVKLKSHQGEVVCNAADAGGTSVDITGLFIDVQAITVTAKGTTPLIALYDFVDAPNPTSFKVLLFTTAGARASGTASFTIRGV